MGEPNHFVYKYVLDGEIIYIGKANEPLLKRLYFHGKPYDNIPIEYSSDLENSKIYFCRLFNETMSDVVESELIRRYKPCLNKMKKSEWSGLGFPEPNWIEYIPLRKNKKCDSLKVYEYLKSIEDIKLFDNERAELKETLKKYGCKSRYMGINTLNKRLRDCGFSFRISSRKEYSGGINRGKYYWIVNKVEEMV